MSDAASLQTPGKALASDGRAATVAGRLDAWKTPETVALFGLPITNVTMAEAVSRVKGYIASGRTHQIATANLDFARNSLRDPYLQRIICECSMVLPDGAPMLWASRMFGAPLQERVTGVDLIPELARLSEEMGYGIYLLGSSEESSRAAARMLFARFPGVKIVGRDCPPVAPLSEMDHEQILRKIEAVQPQIILVGFGNPKQEIWIHRHKDRLPAAVVVGIGGSLDMIAGKLRRAPRWVQAMHLEWFYRMTQEPWRLMPRYSRDAAALLLHLPMGVAASRMQPWERRQRGSAVEVRRGFRVFVTPGKMGDRAGALLVKEAQAAADAGETLILDMAATLRVEAEGLGCMLEARRLMLDEGMWIWLTAMSAPVRRVLQFSAMLDLFRVAQTPGSAMHSTRANQSGFRAAMLENASHAQRNPQPCGEAESVAAKAS